MSGLGASVLAANSAVDGLQEVEIVEVLGEPTRFRVRIAAPIDDGDITALSDPALDPGSLVSIMTGGECLVRGPITGHRVHLTGDSEGSSLDVIGGDRLMDMDCEERISAWTMMRDSDVVSAITAGYGFIPDVEPTGTNYGPTTHELIQRGTDFDFVRRLGARHGFHLWLTSNPLGVETVHFKPAPVSDGPVATLSIHLPGSAFDELDLWWDADRPTSVIAAGLDVGSLATVDASVAGSPLPAMAASNLAAIAVGNRVAVAAGPGDDLATLGGFGEALLADAELFVGAQGTATLERAGTVVHAHTVVMLDGLGARHSGNWLVTAVRHLIDPVAHRMECTFARNGWEG